MSYDKLIAEFKEVWEKPSEILMYHHEEFSKIPEFPVMAIMRDPKIFPQFFESFKNLVPSQLTSLLAFICTYMSRSEKYIPEGAQSVLTNFISNIYNPQEKKERKIPNLNEVILEDELFQELRYQRFEDICSTLQSKFKNSTFVPLGNGASAKVFTLCKGDNNNCFYVLRVSKRSQLSNCKEWGKDAHKIDEFFQKGFGPRIYGVFTCQIQNKNVCVSIMDKAQGKTLNDIYRSSRVSNKLYTDILWHVVNRLIDVHEQNLFHGDPNIKNIMVAQDSDSKLHISLIDPDLRLNWGPEGFYRDFGVLIWSHLFWNEDIEFRYKKENGKNYLQDTLEEIWNRYIKPYNPTKYGSLTNNRWKNKDYFTNVFFFD